MFRGGIIGVSRTLHGINTTTRRIAGQFLQSV
jgi:hypothetical protein